MAKDRDQRYQRGAEFAEDLRQLQQVVQGGLDHGVVAGVLAPGTRSGTRTGRTAVALGSASGGRDGAGGEFAPRRDSKGAGSGSDSGCGALWSLSCLRRFESKLLVISPRAGVNPLPRMASPASLASQISAAGQPNSADGRRPCPATATTRINRRPVAAKAPAAEAPHPATGLVQTTKQVVVPSSHSRPGGAAPVQRCDSLCLGR